MSAGVGPLCFIKSIVNAAVYQEILEHFMLPSADKEMLRLWRCWGEIMEMLISFSSRTLAPAHTVKTTGLLTMILLCLIGQPTCLTWFPYGIYGIISRERWETVDPTIKTSWRLNSASAEPQADCFYATPHWCCNLCDRSPDQVFST